jgi:hypothetical protein
VWGWMSCLALLCTASALSAQQLQYQHNYQHNAQLLLGLKCLLSQPRTPAPLPFHPCRDRRWPGRRAVPAGCGCGQH